MKKKLFMLLLVMLMASGCTKKNTETFQIIEGSNVLTKIENKETFILLIGNEDCYSCDMLKEDIEEEAEKNGLVIYEVNSAKVETKVLDQISIAIGTYDTWPTLFYVVDGEIPLNNKYEYTLDPEGWKTWLKNMNLIK